MDYHVEADFRHGQDRSKEYPALPIDAAQRFQAGGADFIVIPCKSVHIFMDEIRDVGINSSHKYS